MDYRNVSKYISLILRHKPETIGIKLDYQGWAIVDELIEGVQLHYPDFNKDTLEMIVKTDNKQRYSFNDEKTKIRASQGHSINVDLGLQAIQPPKVLYHGTGIKYVERIDKEGLISKSRQFVHLSPESGTAMKVGMRHGEPVLYMIESEKMFEDGYKFYISENGVWLTERVPLIYLRKM